MGLTGIAERVDDYGIDGTHTLYMAKVDGKIHWFKVPNKEAAIMGSTEECSNIMKYYDATGGI